MWQYFKLIFKTSLTFWDLRKNVYIYRPKCQNYVLINIICSYNGFSHISIREHNKTAWLERTICKICKPQSQVQIQRIGSIICNRKRHYYSLGLTNSKIVFIFFWLLVFIWLEEKTPRFLNIFIVLQTFFRPDAFILLLLFITSNILFVFTATKCLRISLKTRQN